MNQSVVDHTQITYRVGRKDDCLRIAELDNIASGGAIEYLFRDLIPGMTPVEIIALNLEQDSYPHTFRNVILAEYKAQILGMALSFPAKYHTITRQMRRFFPAERLRQRPPWRRFRHYPGTGRRHPKPLHSLSIPRRHV